MSASRISTGRAESAAGLRIGMAGWSNPPQHKGQRRAEQSHLQYYAEHFSCVEINSSFYRSHRKSTYSAWNLATPASFRFAVKMPRAITHDGGLEDTGEATAQFFDDIEALQPKLGAVLVQLPPSLEFDAAHVRTFFKSMPKLGGTPLVCEPRHASWFTGAADALLERLNVTRVATDPTAFESARLPGGNPGLAYFRWHGSPRKYYSSYSQVQLAEFAAQVAAVGSPRTWCIFDNTAHQAAWNNATALFEYFAD
jgi:uncharacterized protein YecE (DUF72 family)